MSIRIEFYGIPRERAKTAETVIESCGAAIRLGDVLKQLATRFPALAETCIDQDRLCRGFTISIAGQRFVTDPETRVSAGETLLLMSADAGG
jgi:molybdopterin converting factor small subunit